MRIDERIYRQMLEHVVQEQPVEACGLIAFDHDLPVQLYPGTNILGSTTRYRMADIEVLRAVDDMDRQGWWLGAIYHSHPSSPPAPSTTDLREANWPDALMLIVSLMNDVPETRAYRINGQAYEEVELEVYSERLPWLSAIRRRALRRTFRPGTRSPHSRSDRGRRSIWQPAGIGLPSRGEVVVTSGSERSDRLESLPAEQRGRQGWESMMQSQEFQVQVQPERRAIIGILGGMGPLATADLYKKIIETTPAETDQEHIPVVIYADPRVPDRTEALLRDGEDPTPWLIHGGQQLAAMGADFIVIPCNTAHAFLPRVRPEVDRPFVSMIDAAADEIKATHPDAQTIGLLATSGTIAAGIYQEALRDRGFEVVVPDDEVQQRCVMAAIRDVKGGRGISGATNLFVEASNHLVERGAQLLLEACTEIPIALQPRHVETPLVDATAALARLAVATAIHLDESARSGDPQWETSTTGWDIAPLRTAVRAS